MALKILCVDDDQPQLTIISSVLKKEGYIVDIALDGYQGFEKARTFRPDLIILDIMMPGLNGYQVCQKLQADPETARIGVLMLTAKGGVDEKYRVASEFSGKVKDRMHGFEVGAVEFLTKPIKAKELVQRVKAVLWACGVGVEAETSSS